MFTLKRRQHFPDSLELCHFQLYYGSYIWLVILYLSSDRKKKLGSDQRISERVNTPGDRIQWNVNGAAEQKISNKLTTHLWNLGIIA